jgi:hypothetical protein
VSFKLDAAVREAVTVAAPAVPLAAIHARGGAIVARSQRRRNAFAVAALLLSFAGLALAAGERAAGPAAHLPAPVASIHPAPIVT